MERKTKHRILGIFVVAALVIAILPLFHGSNDMRTEPAIANTPPFPDQAVSVNESATPEFKVALANQSIPIRSNQDNDNGINQLPDDTINPNSSALNTLNKQSNAQENAKSLPQPNATPKSTPMPLDNAVKDPASNDTAANDEEDEVDAEKPAVTPSAGNKKSTTTEANVFRNSLQSDHPVVKKPRIKKTSHLTKLNKHSPLNKHAPLDANGLFKLKSSAWVIQLGSYKNKVNALRLVNRLRANGYRAFIQQASANTMVYVGPENKPETARAVLARLEYEMKVQGYVVSYKPLKL